MILACSAAHRTASFRLAVVPADARRLKTLEAFGIWLAGAAYSQPMGQRQPLLSIDF
jgi:hypothetical protein